MVKEHGESALEGETANNSGTPSLLKVIITF